MSMKKHFNRLGISHKVLMGLSLIVVVAIASGVTAKLFFVRFEYRFKTISEEQLPALITASELVKGTKKLISHAPDIVMAENSLLLALIRMEIEIGFQEDQLLFTRLQEIGFDETGDLPLRFQQLDDNLRKLIDLVISDNEINERIFQIANYIRTLSKSLAITKNQDSRHDVSFRSIQDEFIEIFSLLRDIPNITSIQNLEDYENLIHEHKEVIDKACQTLNFEKETFKLYFKTIEFYGTGEKGLLALTRNHLQQRTLIQDNLIETKFLSDRLVRQTDKIFSVVLENIQEKSRQVEHEIRLLGYLFILIPIVISFSAIFIFLFIRKSVIGRVLSLEQCMRTHVEGNPVPISIKGNDEIASMAKSVSYFINKRNEYETVLKTSKIKAEAANRAKSIFLANMSHELRTPLNGILGYARILDRDPTLSPSQKKGLNIIEQSGDHLLSLINDILDLAKIESDRVELFCEDFCLHDLIRDVENIVRIQAERKGIIFEVEEPDELPDVVNGDEKRLRQVLLNLLGNAVKFTDAGVVTLRMQNIVSNQNRQNAFSLRFEIEDTGIGMSPDNLDRIFEPFQQVGDTDRMGEGTGLGLAISNNLICIMGGKLNVTSTPGQGSCFSFESVLELPDVGFEKKISEDARQIIGIKGKKPIILIVDDSQENRNMLSDLLVSIGFIVVLAEDGEQGLVEAFLSQPDAVITDLVMPGMSGFELIHRIRLSSELATIPIIAASASAFEEDREKTLAAGCRAFFPKPLELNDLLGELKLCLDLQWNYRDIEAASAQEEKNVDIPMVFPQTDEMEKLYQLTLQGAVNQVSAYVEKLENKDIRLKSFAERMHRLLKGFELNRIEAWLESRLQEKKEHP